MRVITLLVIFAVSGLCGVVLYSFCHEPAKAEVPVKPTVVSGITQVLMHEPGNFSFLVKDPATSKVGQVQVETLPERVTLLEDLESEEQVRIEYTCKTTYGKAKPCAPIPAGFSFWHIYSLNLVIHLHSGKEILGGAWDHGKHGQGQTVEVE